LIKEKEHYPYPSDQSYHFLGHHRDPDNIQTLHPDKRMQVESRDCSRDCQIDRFLFLTAIFQDHTISKKKAFIVRLELGVEVYSAKRRAYYQLVRWIHSPAAIALSRYQSSFLPVVAPEIPLVQ
jgi:hypothetical protein